MTNPNHDPRASIVVYTTVADEAAAVALADRIVDGRVAACVQIVPRIRSVYRWQGTVRHDDEAQLVIKTTVDRYDALAALVVEHHPYELPELVAVPVSHGSAAYLDWIAHAVASDAMEDAR